MSKRRQESIDVAVEGHEAVGESSERDEDQADTHTKRARGSLFSSSRFSLAELMAFEAMADLLINRCTLVVNTHSHTRSQDMGDTHTELTHTHTHAHAQTQRFQLCEVEFYTHSHTHADSYTHCNEDQLQYNRFYWHKCTQRSASSYKGGTYKGLDLCFGDSDSDGENNNKLFYGVLIRTIKNIDTHEVIEGPCKSVNAILHALGANDVKSLMARYPHMLSSDCDDVCAAVHLLACADRRERLFAGPRIGLSDKYPAFRDRPYRFCTADVKKGKKSLLPCGKHDS